MTEDTEWDAYILYMLDMIEETPKKGLERLNKVIATMDETTNDIKPDYQRLFQRLN